MITTKSAEASKNMIDQAARTAEHAIKSTRRVTDQALDGLAVGVQDMREEASPMLEQASALAHQGIDAVREGAQQVREGTARASDAALTYIRDEPLKSVLIAAATGAALMALIGFVARARK